MLGAIAIALSISACSSHSAAIAPTPPGPFASQADQVVADLAAGNFTVVEAKFDPTVTASLPLSALQSAWTTYQESMGSYKSHIAPASVRQGQLDVERVPVTMTNGQGEVRITFNTNGTIAGLYFLKAGAPAP